ncbi:UDP-glucuronosyl/UDP-glucosyltransferase [Cynara cardunculus var. scolymus]|uniref:UDP-glucuronosyl/UDP-glucosyltransferase n=1 Tax=Cynara cardunculus var. scolymus TaxID=59895 RepID=A0A103XYP1_CYNCS|nr:UDP-glucuronosyl/UDP-glucosyltransferase [Cynara cardunculus var. scolymus]
MHHSNTSKAHLLIYPLSSSGHIIPLLDLTHLLLRRGLTITVIISSANLHLLRPLLSSYPSSLHQLLFPDPAVTPSPYPIVGRVIATQKLFDPIVRWFQSHPSPPVAIVSDFFLGWTTDLASHLGIRRVVFSPSGALGSSIFQTLWRDLPEINAGDDSCSLSFPEIPNSPEFPRWQLSQFTRLYKKGEPDLESFRNGMLANMTSWGIVYNTFQELEGVYIDHMKKQMGHDRIWAVGPLLPDDHGPIVPTERGGASVVPPDDLLVWLNKKPDNSTVYICFGSRFTLSENQMSALACALELSNVNFILCEKADDSSSSLIPSGFESRVAGRGFIVKGWAPQLAILRHKAVGSFVTHCGWNSILEAVAAGVMMLTWPMGADQYANAKLLVDQLGIGKRVCEGGPESVPDSVELARLLDESLSGDRPERVKVNELSQAAIKANGAYENV